MVVRVGLVQEVVSGVVREDLERVGAAVRQLALDGCNVVSLGEMFCCPYERGAFSRYKQERGGLVYSTLSEIARKCGVLLIGGSIPLFEGGKIYNASFVFDATGREVACYKKIHLFDVDIKGEGLSGIRFKESDDLCAGDKIAVFDTEFGRFGVCICYDLRFGELFLAMRAAGVDCIFVPAAFNNITGPMHWQTLFRARSIDNQIFTVGVSPARGGQAKYQAYGHSIAVTPTGKILKELDEKAAAVYVDLDFDEIKKARKAMPLFGHKRPEVYKSQT